MLLSVKNLYFYKYITLNTYVIQIINFNILYKYNILEICI